MTFARWTRACLELRALPGKGAVHSGLCYLNLGVPEAVGFTPLGLSFFSLEGGACLLWLMPPFFLRLACVCALDTFESAASRVPTWGLGARRLSLLSSLLSPPPVPTPPRGRSQRGKQAPLLGFLFFSSALPLADDFGVHALRRIGMSRVWRHGSRVLGEAPKSGLRGQSFLQEGSSLGVPP